MSNIKVMKVPFDSISLDTTVAIYTGFPPVRELVKYYCFGDDFVITDRDSLVFLRTLVIRALGELWSSKDLICEDENLHISSYGGTSE
jgi:hypothetical protein